MNYQLYNGDCLEEMKKIPSESVDGIFTDLPYGKTGIKWDAVIPFAPMWESVLRILKPNGVFITTAIQPFTSLLILSNMELFKYDIVWEKTKSINFFHAHNMPLQKHESILVFSRGIVAHAGKSKKRMTYNPQGIKEDGKKWARPKDYDGDFRKARPSHKLDRIQEFSGFPGSVLKIGSAHNPPHPTQKPIPLYEWLIRTYTNPGDTIADIAAGSGTTGVAAVRTSRNFIGIERDPKYFQIMRDRVEAELLTIT